MADPPPVPAASTPVPPPLNKMPFVFVQIPDGHGGMASVSGFLTIPAISFLTQFWAALIGDGGITPSVNELITQMATVFGMHGDGTLSVAGVLTVTETNGVPFGPFATGTDAGNLTGNLSPARLVANSVPYAKLVNLAAAGLLGAGGASPVVEIHLGRGLTIAANTLNQGDPITTVGALGAATQGFRAFVTDSNVVAAGNFGNVVAAGGANYVPVYADGAAWRIG